MILQKVAIIEDYLMEAPNIDHQTVERPTRARMLEKMAEFHTIANAALIVEQQRVFERLVSTTSGLHVVYGTPGSGKSFLIWYYVLHLVAQNKMVILCASTRTVVTQLSGIATIVHYQFKILVCSNQYPLNIHETDE